MADKDIDKKSDDNGQSVKRRHRFKVPRRYRLSFVNESTLNRVWTIGMSRGRMWAYIVAIVVFIALAGAAALSFTPLKVLLPGYLKPAERREYIKASEQLDSIVERANVTDAYLRNISDILDDNISVDSLFSVPPPPAYDFDAEALEASSAEREYVERYLAGSGFDLNASPAAESGPDFVSPVDNAIVSRGRSAETTRITLSQSRNVVSSIAPGTVVGLNNNSDGSTVSVQHQGGYLSQYGQLSEVYVKAGDRVNAGQRLGVAKSGGTRSQRLWDFALWHDGKRLQPLDYIPF